MKKVLLVVAALVVMSTSVDAQQLNVGVGARKDSDHAVVDLVPMQKVGEIYLYGQVTFAGQDRPELTVGTEIPIIDTKHFYLGLDNSIGWYGSYGRGVYVLGTTIWAPVARGFGLYGMASATPTVEGSSPTIQGGIFKQVF